MPGPVLLYTVIHYGSISAWKESLISSDHFFSRPAEHYLCRSDDYQVSLGMANNSAFIDPQNESILFGEVNQLKNCMFFQLLLALLSHAFGVNIELDHNPEH